MQHCSMSETLLVKRFQSWEPFLQPEPQFARYVVTDTMDKVAFKISDSEVTWFCATWIQRFKNKKQYVKGLIRLVCRPFRFTLDK